MIRITYPLSAIHASPDNKFGAIISAGWFDPAAARDYDVVEVTFNSILVNDDHDGFLNKWINLGQGTGLNNVGDGDTRLINKSVKLVFPKNGVIHIVTSAIETDCMDSRFGGSGLGSDIVSSGDPAAIIGYGYGNAVSGAFGGNPELGGAIGLLAAGGYGYVFGKGLCLADQDDSIGIFDKQHPISEIRDSQSFREPSIRNPYDDPKNDDSTQNDFVLYYTIKKLPPVSIIYEVHSVAFQLVIPSDLITRSI